MNTLEPTPDFHQDDTEERHTKAPTHGTLTYNGVEGIEPLPAPGISRDSSRLMHAYMVLALIANVGLLFLKGYSQDLGYWQDWVRQLSTTGYDGFNGNYPPFYVHWLYLVGKFYTTLAIPLEHNYFLKFLTQIPVALFHCLLVAIIFYQLKRFNASRHIIHLTLALTALNPAILVNGPIWGQVDLIPATITLAALLLATGERYVHFSIPLFALALLTKFQMIAFAPVFGFLFFKHVGKHLLGILIAIVIGALVFLPSILAGHFWMSFRQAYIDTLGQYPMTTFNAANLWILLTGNTTPDNIILFGVNPDSALSKIFTAKYFGMILFSLTALFVFLQGIHLLIKTTYQSNTQALRAHSLFAATICALAFFTLLPAMHERYLFPAVVMALGYFAIQPKHIIYPAAISLFCSLNMLIILEINGSDIWHGLAWLTLGLLILGLLELGLGKRFSQPLRQCALFIYKVPALSVWAFVICITGMAFFFVERYQIHHLQLTDNQRFLTDLSMDYARQDHGTVKLNRSFDNNHLSLNNRRFAQGIGTHANSDIQFQLPEGAIEFSFIVGLDDEVGTADAKFSVWGDDRLLWESPEYLGYEKNLPVHKISVRGIKKLNLRVAALKEDKWDHVDWVNTVITFEQAIPHDPKESSNDKNNADERN
jgi:Gpi18-like mannosyltransferase